MPFTRNVLAIAGCLRVLTAADTMQPFLRPFLVPYRTHAFALVLYRNVAMASDSRMSVDRSPSGPASPTTPRGAFSGAF